MGVYNVTKAVYKDEAVWSIMKKLKRIGKLESTTEGWVAFNHLHKGQYNVKSYLKTEQN